MENFTAAETERCPSLTEDKLEVKIIKILAYSIVLIVSLFGNSVIIATVISNRRMQTTVNYLIANMAASDLFISVFAVPMKISEIVKGRRRWLVAQSVERRRSNPKVVGSIPTLVRLFLCPCVDPFPSVGLTLTWFIWDRNIEHFTLHSIQLTLFKI